MSPDIAHALHTAPYGSPALLDAIDLAFATGGELERLAEERCEREAERAREQDAQDAADLARHWPPTWKYKNGGVG